MVTTGNRYEDLRNQYLFHVERCAACNQNHYSHRGTTLQHWTVWSLCAAARFILDQIHDLL